MSLPFSTTTITIRRPTAGGGQAGQAGMRDPYDEAEQVPSGAGDPQVIATGIRAVIGQPGGSSTNDGASIETGARHLTADPCDLEGDDLVIDDVTGEKYTVQWRQARTDFDHEVDHIEAGLAIHRSGA